MPSAKVLPLHPRRSARAKPELTFALERFADIAPELPDLFVRQWRELEDEDYPLAVDWKAFYAHELQGSLLVSVARADGKIVGFIFALFLPTLNHATTLHCLVERFWLDPAHRGGWFAMRWFRDLIDEARERGAKRLLITENIKFMRGRMAFFRRLGLNPAQATFAMRL